jgi:hypothetical protein
MASEHTNDPDDDQYGTEREIVEPGAFVAQVAPVEAQVVVVPNFVAVESANYPLAEHRVEQQQDPGRRRVSVLGAHLQKAGRRTRRAA